MMVLSHMIVPKPKEETKFGGEVAPEEIAVSTISLANSSISQLRVALIVKMQEGELS